MTCKQTTAPDPVTTMLHLRADVLRMLAEIEALADLPSIAHVRTRAPAVAGRMRGIVNKPEYVEASKR